MVAASHGMKGAAYLHTVRNFLGELGFPFLGRGTALS